MKMRSFNIAAAFAALCLMTTGCVSKAAHDEHEHDHAEAHEHPAGHVHGHDEEADEHEDHAHEADEHSQGEGFGSLIELSDEVAVRFGVETDTVAAGSFSRAARASGMIMPSTDGSAVVAAPRAGLVKISAGIEPGSEVRAGQAVAIVDATAVSGGDSNEGARLTLENARAEYERLERLYADRLTTLAELNAARAAYDAARAAYSPRASQGAATSPMSGIITTLDVVNGQFVNPGDPIATVASERNVTLRIDVPQKYLAQLNSFTDAVITLPYGETFSVKAKGGRRVAGKSLPATNAPAAYVPVYFTVPNDGSLLPSTSFTAHLLGSEQQGVISVPVEALSEQQGKYFVYTLHSPGHYLKVPVATGNSNGQRVEITAGLHPGQIVVVGGTTTVRLAESGSAIPEGHSHNH